MDTIQHQKIALLAALVVAAGAYYLVRSRQKSIHKRPPGPPGLPLLGNVLQIPGQVRKTFTLLGCYIAMSDFMDRIALGYVFQEAH